MDPRGSIGFWNRNADLEDWNSWLHEIFLTFVDCAFFFPNIPVGTFAYICKVVLLQKLGKDQYWMGWRQGSFVEILAFVALGHLWTIQRVNQTMNLVLVCNEINQNTLENVNVIRLSNSKPKFTCIHLFNQSISFIAYLWSTSDAAFLNSPTFRPVVGSNNV